MVRAVDTSWGTIRFHLDGELVSACRLPSLQSVPEEPFRITSLSGDPGLDRWLEHFFGGDPRLPEMPFCFSAGTEFERKVWAALKTIPYGKTLSYGELACRLGKKGAARAVGSACGKNPIPLILPCHRVIRADGSLGGFSAGVAWKELLLRMESQ